jgi:hypothetical protein
LGKVADERNHAGEQGKLKSTYLDPEEASLMQIKNS